MRAGILAAGAHSSVHSQLWRSHRGSHGCSFPKAVVIPGRGTCSESKFDHGRFQPRIQRFCGEAQAHWPHPHCAGDRSQTEMLCHPLWPHFSSSHSPRHPKICFRGSNSTLILGSDSTRHIMRENRHQLSHKCIKLLYFQYTFI